MRKRIWIWCLFGIWCLGCGIYVCADNFIYDAKGKRDPFMPLIGSQAVYEVKGAVEIKSIEDVSLEGIVYDEKGISTAIINGTILKEGNRSGVALVDKIDPKAVILLIGEKRYEVTLGVKKEEVGEDGKQ